MPTTNTLSNKEDRELKREQIQQLSSADALVAFFADLGYNTNARVKQTANAMGITDADLVGSIKNVERLAREEILPFEIYLFELKSLTVARRQALMGYFLKRPGDILLVLTDNYQSLDFVLLEKSLQKIKTMLPLATLTKPLPPPLMPLAQVATPK